jgi:hypothetical protein
VEINGTLKDISLDVLLSMIHDTNKSGILTVRWECDDGSNHNGTITFSNGLLVEAKTEKFTDIPAIEEIAISDGYFSFESNDINAPGNTLDFEHVIKTVQETLNIWQKLKSTYLSLQDSLNDSTSNATNYIKMSSEEFSVITLLVRKPGISIYKLVYESSITPLDVLNAIDSLMRKGLIGVHSESVLTNEKYNKLSQTVLSFTGTKGEAIVQKYFRVGMPVKEAINNMMQFEHDIVSMVGRNIGAKVSEDVKNILENK